MTRSRSSRWVATAAAALVLLAGAPTLASSTPSPPPAPAASAGYVPVGSWMLLAEVNRSRRSAGLPPLADDTRLASTARAWVEHLSRAGRLAHNDSLFTAATKQRLGMRLVGENVGFNSSVAAQHRAFMGSPGHRANVLHRSFRSAGVAVVRDGTGRLWSVQVFGLPR